MPNFLIYKSSAGSGKTYTLVKEYLKIVLNNPDNFRHVLAITFTNKAAGEMKQRIIDKLKDLAEEKDPELEQTLKNEGVKSIIKLNAEIVLNRILHSYSLFSVFTIDSFLLRVVRSFSKELKLQLGYNIEMDVNEVMERITDNLLSDIGKNPELTSYLEDFVYQNIDDSKGWKIDKAIRNVGMEIFKERHWQQKLVNTTDIYDDRSKIKILIKELFNIVNGFEKEMLSLSEQAQEIIEGNGLKMEDFAYGRGGVAGHVLVNLRLPNKYEPTARAAGALEDPSKWYSKTSKNKIAILKAVNNGLQDVLVKAVDNYSDNFLRYNTAKELVKMVYVLGIFNDLLDKLKTYRDENRVLLISDLNNILQKVTEDNNSPFVFEKIGNYYKYFLIDEFQDTSTFQWNNILPLILNSLSENYFSMVVGDVKQSIYRWRSGNMKLLMENIYEDLRIFHEEVEDRYLDSNRRSCKEVVRFNNKFFKAAAHLLSNRSEDMSSDLYEKAYEDCEQKVDYCKEGGYIKVTFNEDDEEKGVSSRNVINESVYNNIIELGEDGYSPRDITILVRTNKEGSEIAGYLLDKDIRVISNESLYLINSPNVKLLINLLQYIADNNNVMAKTEILLNYCYIQNNLSCLSDIFEDYSRIDDCLFYKIVPQEFFYIENGIVNYKKLNPRLHNLSLYELVETLISIFKLNEKPDAYLLRFQDALIEYLKTHTSDVVSFNDWWEENNSKFSIIVPEQEDAVKIMTIHKAKGLQNKIIIIPYADWRLDIDSTKETIWVSTDVDELLAGTPFLVKAIKNLTSTYFDKDYRDELVQTYLDNLNLLYVAFTRAVDRLYINIPSSKKKNNNTAGKLIKEIITLDENFIRDFKPGEDYYEKGLKQKNEYIAKESSVISEPLKTQVSTNWFQKIVIKPKHQSLDIVKNKRAVSDEVWNKLVKEALLKLTKPGEVNAVVSQMKFEGIITEALFRKLQKSLKELMSLPEMKIIFNGTNGQGLLIKEIGVRKPDKIIIKGNIAIIINFIAEITDKESIGNLKSYCEILKKSGINEVEMYAVNIFEKKVIKL
ncbi:MAG: hypothetical protein EHM58_12365 [Ignavibacteriae bacterium]|nr:MAG: hypothetical protein EHM58_12365 [Ignavibacteriota bacterium]